MNQGPLIDEAAVEKVEQPHGDAVAKGARVLAGGKRLAGGSFFEPTVLADATADMLLRQRRNLRPGCAGVPSSRQEQEAMRRWPTTPSSAWPATSTAATSGRICRVAEALEYGMVGINDGIISTEHVPFGGVKQSGLGREGSHHGMDDYVEIKYLCLGDILK